MSDIPPRTNPEAQTRTPDQPLYLDPGKHGYFSERSATLLYTMTASFWVALNVPSTDGDGR